MAAQQVTTKGKLPEGKGVGEVTVTYDFGDTLDAARKLFGDEVIHKHAESSMVIWLQAAVRRLIAKGKSAAEIQTTISTMKPGLVVRTSKDMSAECAKFIRGLPPEERVREIEKLKALLAAK
jgi:hypothetical protein